MHARLVQPAYGRHMAAVYPVHLINAIASSSTQQPVATGTGHKGLDVQIKPPPQDKVCY